MSEYRERLVPPPSWFIGTAVFAVVCGWVIVVVTTPTAALITGLIVLVACWAALARISTQIHVTDDRLVVGRATLPLRFAKDPRALDAESMRWVLGPGADARSWLVTRPYLRAGVIVEIADVDDPTPSWVLSSRHPDQLAEAIDRASRPTKG